MDRYFFHALNLRTKKNIHIPLLSSFNAISPRVGRARGKKSARPFVSTVCGRVDERGRAKETVGGRVGQTGHGYATDGVVRGQKPDIADRSTRSAPLTGILVT